MVCLTGVLVANRHLVHAPLAHWAQHRGEWVALDDGETTFTFATLHAEVAKQAHILTQGQAPAIVFVDDTLSTLQQIVTFLAIITSGRCAAVTDPDWPDAVRQNVKTSFSQAPFNAPPPTPQSPFYIGFTSGSTGVPKGFQRHHQSWTESLQVCLDTFGDSASTRVLAPGRFSHSLFLFGMMLGLWSGAGVVVQERFSAARMMDTLQQGHTPCVVAVPSQLILMLTLAQRRHTPPVLGVRLILISGARWMRERTAALQALFPKARIVEFYGASETSFMTWMDADASAPAQTVGKPFSNVRIAIRNPQPPLGTGQIFVRSPMLFMGYVGPNPDHTAAVREGDWLSVRDMGYVDEQGLLHLVGRENRMVVTQGKNLFPEEVETVLLSDERVAQASVQGVTDAVRGQMVVAVLQLRAGDSTLTAQDAITLCRSRLEAYKVPKRVWVCADWPFTASGKTDHAALAHALQTFDPTQPKGLPCLHPLP